MATFDLTSEQQRHVFEFIQTHPIPSELKVTPVKLQAAFNMAVALARAVEMQPGFTEAGIGPGAALGFVTPTQVGFTVGQLNIASGLLTALQPVTVKPPSMLKTEMMTFLTLVETIEHEAEVELPTLAEVFGITSVTVTTVPTDKEVEALTPASLRHVPSNFDPTIQGYRGWTAVGVPGLPGVSFSPNAAPTSDPGLSFDVSSISNPDASPGIGVTQGP